jgi:hypothetical protein
MIELKWFRVILSTVEQFPEICRTRNFRPYGGRKKRLGSRFYRETAWVEAKNGNYWMDLIGLLGLIAASLVLPLLLFPLLFPLGKLLSEPANVDV